MLWKIASFGDAGFDEYDLFSPPSLKEICFDYTMPPIYDDYNDECDISSPPTIKKKTYYDYDMPPIYDYYNDGYDSFTTTITNEKDFAYEESNNNFMHVDHDKNALCDGYIIEFANDATESYLNNIMFPLFMLKVLMLHLLCLPMLITMCFIALFLQNPYA